MSKILVIEDEEPVRANIQELLENEGYETLTAENGLVGVKLACEHLPDLIICDIMMPELDGHGVLNALRQDPVTATLPFIFLTARAERADLRQGMQLGADDYLTKPFTRAELLTAVSTRLTRQAVVAAQAQKKLDDLRSSVTLSLPHELRTPLTLILGYAEVLLEQYDSLEKDEALDMMNSIHRAAERLNRLVQNFVLYAELEMAAQDPHRLAALREDDVCCAQPIVSEQAIGKANQTNRAVDLSLELRDAAVRMPGASLKKVVEELVDNAFRYSHVGSPVHIVGKPDAHRFVLTITDHGRGMTAGQIAAVGAYMQFERKLHEQQGSGLGLTIARRLIELYEGELTISSVPGHHTTVRVVLPSAHTP